MSGDRIDVMDLIIDVLKGHEKDLDVLAGRFEKSIKELKSIITKNDKLTVSTRVQKLRRVGRHHRVTLPYFKEGAYLRPEIHHRRDGSIGAVTLYLEY